MAQPQTSAGAYLSIAAGLTDIAAGQTDIAAGQTDIAAGQTSQLDRHRSWTDIAAGQTDMAEAIAAGFFQTADDLITTIAREGTEQASALFVVALVSA